jgi:thiol:disulfide interchange protein DsbC
MENGMKKRLTIMLTGALASMGLLAGAVAHAGEAEARAAAEKFVAGRSKIESVRKSAAPGLYEVRLPSNELFYVSESGDYAVLGDLINIKQNRNLSEERRNHLSQIKFNELPLNLAIKQVRGNGKRVIATFEDPNCGYCKKLAKEMQSLTDVTIYTFTLPVLSPDSRDKSVNIMCAADPAKAWNDWMINGVVPPVAKCDHSVDKISQLGQKLNVRGTPAIFFADGSRTPGYLPAAELDARISAATIAATGSK